MVRELEEELIIAVKGVEDLANADAEHRKQVQLFQAKIQVSVDRSQHQQPFCSAFYCSWTISLHSSKTIQCQVECRMQLPSICSFLRVTYSQYTETSSTSEFICFAVLVDCLNLHIFSCVLHIPGSYNECRLPH
jgi:meiotically up-regulated gene 157 (Mug157) protein